MKILNGDCLEIMKTMEDNSVDSIVTDPPYGLSFMGKKWDYDVPSVEIWQECLRVLKPGGHMLSACGTRTQHRMVVNIEDAGFEVRDVISHVYGSGFPKSHNIGKAVDKLGGRTLGLEVGQTIKKKREELGYSTIKLAELGGFYGKTNHGGTVSNWETGNGSITPEQFNKLIDILKLEDEPVIANKRKYLGSHNFGASSIYGSEIYNKRKKRKTINITKGTSPYEGWGTALKPACEFWTLCRKPLSEKNIAENVLKHGTGGINIDGCRVGNSGGGGNGLGSHFDKLGNTKPKVKHSENKQDTQGRFPANLIHDGSDEVVGLFPETSGAGNKIGTPRKSGTFFTDEQTQTNFKYDKGGNTSRFFYCAKASKQDRNEGLEGFEKKAITDKKGNGLGRVCNICGVSQLKPCNCKNNSWILPTKNKNNHPTVKPTKLMQYLVRLVTPKGGVCLDPFMGSGSTGKACKLENFDFIGIDLDEEYCKIAEARINNQPQTLL